MDTVALTWAVGRRIPRRVADLVARLVAPAAALMSLPAVDAWAESVEIATGRAPTPRQRRLLLQAWIRNNLWSLSLARWSTDEVLATVAVDDVDVARLRDSLAGPGLVAALPHMGSWDFAGAWASRMGMSVVSVAERLPRGLYERFSAARRGMGIDIYPVDQPDVVRLLTDDVHARRLVCLLADRDLSSRGVLVPWPGSGRDVAVARGPAHVALRSGADLRVVTTHFDGPRLRIEVSEPVEGESVEELMAGVARVFADAVSRHPESWLMLRRVFR